MGKERVTMKKKTVYYTSESDDLFSAEGVVAKKIDASYRYHRTNPLWLAASFFLHRIIAPPLAFLYTKIKFSERFVGKRALRKHKRDGYMIFMNHTLLGMDALTPNLAAFPKKTFIIVHPDNVSLPVIGRITPFLGALPLPSDLKSTRNFTDKIGTVLKSRGVVAVYPEARTWPYYTKIRDFPSTSFTFAVKFDSPVYALTRTFSRGLFGRVKSTVFVDGPFYPDKSIPPREAKEKLCAEVKAKMKERAALSSVEVIEYKKRENEEKTQNSEE